MPNKRSHDADACTRQTGGEKDEQIFGGNGNNCAESISCLLNPSGEFCAGISNGIVFGERYTFVSDQEVIEFETNSEV